jgi:hypothetical protein
MEAVSLLKQSMGQPHTMLVLEHLKPLIDKVKVSPSYAPEV